MKQVFDLFAFSAWGLRCAQAAGEPRRASSYISGKMGVVALALLCGAAVAQGKAQGAAPLVQSPTPKLSMYFPGPGPDLAVLLSGPPAADSAEGRADLGAVLHAQATRTPAQVREAQRDDREEDIFIYATVLGPKFRADDLPLTAALSRHVINETASVNPAMKVRFARPRPFRASKAVHPVCDLGASESYPSGHSMLGYLEGYTLALMVPEQNAAILARAREYAANRVVCGVHYPSDTEASRTVSLAMFGALVRSQKFTDEVVAARAELRTKLGMRQ